MFNCFDWPAEVVAFNDDRLSGKSSVVRAVTISPPSTDRNGSISAANPMLFQSSVPLKNDTMRRADGCIWEEMLAMPCALAVQRPAKLTNPPPLTWQNGSTRVRPGW